MSAGQSIEVLKALQQHLGIRQGSRIEFSLIGLDTNILARYDIDDDADAQAQHQRVARSAPH